jgi:hypothetical protein
MGPKSVVVAVRKVRKRRTVPAATTSAIVTWMAMTTRDREWSVPW